MSLVAVSFDFWRAIPILHAIDFEDNVIDAQHRYHSDKTAGDVDARTNGGGRDWHNS